MKVKFVPQNVEFEIRPGESVMHVAQDHGLYIKSVCKGVPSCAECRVRVVDGEHNVLQPGPEELSLIGTGHFIDQRRLSCQLKCFGDITIDMTEQIAKEQGLIGGQKMKRLSIKDDRIEDAAIRSGSPDSADDGDEIEEGHRESPAAALESSAREEADDGADDESDDEEELLDAQGARGEGSPAGDASGAPRTGRRRRRRGGRGNRGGGGRGGGGQPGSGRGNNHSPPNRN